MEDIDLRQVKIGYFPDSLILLLINFQTSFEQDNTPLDLQVLLCLLPSSLNPSSPPPYLHPSSFRPSLSSSPFCFPTMTDGYHIPTLQKVAMNPA